MMLVDHEATALGFFRPPLISGRFARLLKVALAVVLGDVVTGLVRGRLRRTALASRIFRLRLWFSGARWHRCPRSTRQPTETHQPHRRPSARNLKSRRS